MGRVETNFKQTEIGLVPADWEVKELKDIGECVIGLTYSPSNVRSYGTLVLRSSNVQNGRLSFDDNVFVDMDLPQRVIVKESDILICARNGSKHLIGKCALINKKTSGSAFGAFMSVYRGEFPKLVFHQFRSDIIQKQIEETLGATINQITNKDLRSFRVVIPTNKTEQTAIANALSDADGYIESLEKLIAKKQLIKQGAMQQLLSPKPHWEIKKIDKIAEVIGGGTPSTFVPQYWNGDINWFTPTEIGFHKYVSESIRKITKEGASSCASKVLPIGAVLLTTRAGIGDASILLCEGSTNQGFQSLVARDGYSNEYIYYLILTLKKVLLQRASGSTFLEISPNKIREIEVCIPPYDEQLRIAGTLSEMDLEITILNNKLIKAQNLKQGMMQQLLTGKIRLV